MKKAQISPLAVFVVIVIAVAIIFLVWGVLGGFTGKSIFEPNCKEVEVPYEEQEEYMKTEYYTETEPYTDRECETKNLVYSITDFVMNSQTCNQQTDICLDRTIFDICTNRQYYCIDKTISCSLKLNNLDTEQGGQYSISFNFFPVGTNDIETKQNTQYLYPSTSQSFSQSVRITSEGTGGKANKDFSCNYAISSVPTKQVCRDVIKYKEVQKERQVTAYKPVTKYKTETQCE